MLYVYGDAREPLEETVQLVHLQLQELLQEIFRLEKVHLVLASKQSGEGDLYTFSDSDGE